MGPIVAVIAPGAMGSGVGQRLAEHGAEVRTSTAGRSAATIERAIAARMIAVEDRDIAESQIILSIVPPGDALGVAQRLAPVLARAERKPVFVDCNAVSPDTVREIAAALAATGCPFVDAGIIGGPPKPGEAGPTFYASGPAAEDFERLCAPALEIKRLDETIGTASSLKMSYAGITKGMTALGTAMMLAATRAGVGDALAQELAASQPMLLKIFNRSVPGMFPKAYRWIREMEEIGHFSGDAATKEIYEGVADLYRRIAADVDGPNRDTAALKAFFRRVAQ